MSHTSEKRWPEVVALAEAAATSMLAALLHAESKYQELLEMYDYVGSTAQDLADQLFLDVWSVRSTQGDQAILTFDVVGGIIDDVTINDGGTGYTDGVGFLMAVAGGAGDGVIRYDVAGGIVTAAVVDAAGTTYTNGVGQALNGFPAAGLIPDAQASAAEVAMSQDLIDVSLSLHQMYQAADNVAVAQEDRLTAFRRFT